MSASVAKVAPSAPKSVATPKSGKAPTFASTAVITLVATANPKAQGTASHKRFACYKSGITVGAYIAACKAGVAGAATGRNARADIAWDAERGYITVK